MAAHPSRFPTRHPLFVQSRHHRFAGVLKSFFHNRVNAPPEASEFFFFFASLPRLLKDFICGSTTRCLPHPELIRPSNRLGTTLYLTGNASACLFDT